MNTVLIMKCIILGSQLPDFVQHLDSQLDDLIYDRGNRNNHNNNHNYNYNYDYNNINDNNYNNKFKRHQNNEDDLFSQPALPVCLSSLFLFYLFIVI